MICFLYSITHVLTAELRKLVAFFQQNNQIKPDTAIPKQKPGQMLRLLCSFYSVVCLVLRTRTVVEALFNLLLGTNVAGQVQVVTINTPFSLLVIRFEFAVIRDLTVLAYTVFLAVERNFVAIYVP